MRREANRYYRNKKKKYPRDRSNVLATNSKIKDTGDCIRRINEFKRGYHPRSNLVKDEKGDQLADSHIILNSWMSYFY
jgi:hypothetical protein